MVIPYYSVAYFFAHAKPGKTIHIWYLLFIQPIQYVVHNWPTPGEFYSKRDDIAENKERKKEIERVLRHYARISQYYHPAGLRTVTKSRRPNYIKYAQ